MSRISRYLHLWRTLPPAERRARAGRVADRLIGRRIRPGRLRPVGPPSPTSPLRRALSIDPPRLLERLRGVDPARGPLFADLDARAARVARRCPRHVARIFARTDDLLERRFDLLGSGPVSPLLADGRIDWQLDFVHGARWDAATYCEDQPLVRGDGSDVKIPWELARFQHLLVLGQAYRLAPHRLADGAAGKLRTRAAGEAARQIDEWNEANPRGRGIHWSCAMEVALRAVSWSAALAFFRDAPEWDDAFLLRLVRALRLHGIHIRRHLEREPATNHYLADLLGLLAIGRTLPELKAAPEWIELALAELARQIRVQVGADGVGFERSLPYHRLTAELLLHAAMLAGPSDLPPAYPARLAAMLEFTAACLRPDGTVPQWGDNDDGRVLPLSGYATRNRRDHRHLLELGGRMLHRPELTPSAAEPAPDPLWLLEPGGPVAATRRAPAAASRGFVDGGFYLLQAEDLQLTVSAAGVGTDGLGNHGHNDALSVCVWAAGREWITDPGSGVYGADVALRNRLRGTAAHATLQLGDREQNEVPPGVHGLFRLVERARPTIEAWECDADGAHLRARHDGFGHGWVHRRDVRFDPRRRRWAIEDELRGTPAGVSATPDAGVWLRYPLAPGVSAELLPGLPVDGPAEALVETGPGARFALARLVDGAGRLFWIGLGLPAGSEVALDWAPVSPGYGVTERAAVLVARMPLAATVRCRTLLLAPAGRVAT